MTPPTLVSFAETTWNAAGTPKTASISWLPGDFIVFIGGDAGGGTIDIPTATGLTFLSVRSNTAASTCDARVAVCMPNTSGSAVTVSGTNASATNHWGFGVWVWRNSLGGGQSFEQHTTTKTVSMTPSSANCGVCWGIFDFSAEAAHTIVPTPTNTREATATAQYTAHAADLIDQTSGGATSYGVSGGGSTGPYTIIGIEIMSSADGRTGGAVDDRFRFRGSNFMAGGTSAIGQHRSTWPDDARDFGCRDAVADNRTRFL